MYRLSFVARDMGESKQLTVQYCTANVQYIALEVVIYTVMENFGYCILQIQKKRLVYNAAERPTINFRRLIYVLQVRLRNWWYILMSFVYYMIVYMDV